MKQKDLKKSAFVALTGIMCALTVPAIPTAVYTANAASAGQTLSVGNGRTQYKEDNVDGYSYEIWLDQTGGSGSMTLGSGGAFNTEWSAQVSAGNFLARRGRNYDASKKATQYGNIVLDYAADYSASSQGNSRLCVYGWFKNPLVEYYIIEDWVNWRPTGNSQTVTIDGAEYEIFQLDHTGPTILGTTETFKQYFSVRKQKRTSGTITVSDHFKAWENAGWNIGNLTEVALNVEGWESSGKANVSKLTISSGGTSTTTQPAVQQPVHEQPAQQQNNDWSNWNFNNDWNNQNQQNNDWNSWNQNNDWNSQQQNNDWSNWNFNNDWNNQNQQNNDWNNWSQNNDWNNQQQNNDWNNWSQNNDWNNQQQNNDWNNWNQNNDWNNQNQQNIDWNGMAGGFNNTNSNVGSDPGNGGNAKSGLNAKIKTDMPTSVPAGAEKSGGCKVEKKTYNCKFTGGTKSCNVILPPNYNSSKQYPVMYVLHGIGGNEDSMVSGMGVQELLAGLTASGEAEEMIIVLPSQYTSKNGNAGGGFGIDQATCEAYDNFLYDISDSLIDFIESNYSVKPGRENRAITGFSMGGREAIYIGLMRPDLFGYVGGACPAPGITPATDMFMTHPGCMTESEMKFRSVGPEPEVFMITGGTNDSVVGTFPKQYSDILTNNGVEHVYQSIPGGGHGADSVKPHLYTFMRYAFKGNGGSSDTTSYTAPTSAPQQQNNDWNSQDQQQSNDWTNQSQQNNDWNNQVPSFDWSSQGNEGANQGFDWNNQNNDWNNWNNQSSDWNNWNNQNNEGVNQGFDWSNQNNDWNNWNNQNQSNDWNNWNNQNQNNDWNNWNNQNQNNDWNSWNNQSQNNDWNWNNQNQNNDWNWNNQNQNNDWNNWNNQNQNNDWNNWNNQGFDWNNWSVWNY